VLQPVVGVYTDKHPKPHSLSIGMGFTLIGLLTLSLAPNYASVLAAAAFVGAGSSIFHPESSRIARLASGGVRSDRCLRLGSSFRMGSEASPGLHWRRYWPSPYYGT
jgi:MFS family permease